MKNVNLTANPTQKEILSNNIVIYNECIHKKSILFSINRGKTILLHLMSRSYYFLMNMFATEHHI